MRIVIDMQGAQGANSLRGIGRYSIALAKAIILNRGEHEVVLALNGMLVDSVDMIRSEYEGLLPRENIVLWYFPTPVNTLNCENDIRRNFAELLREAFLASLRPDVVLVTSLFEGLGDDVITSVGSFTLNLKTAVILYDLIPFIRRTPYLDNSLVEVWYEKKLDQLRRADRLLAISESSRMEGLLYLGFPEDECVNISTAVDSYFHRSDVSASSETELRNAYKLTCSFVMYTGGIDHRKNIEGLIRAYSLLPIELRKEHQLAVVCNVQETDRLRLQALARQSGLRDGELVLTGYVSEQDLLILYSLCRVFVFPSYHEGFGLPALEAMACGKAVIGSNSSSIPEVIGRPDALFDPYDDQDIANKLKSVLIDDDFRYELESHGLEQSRKFSWNNTAQLAIKELESLYESSTSDEESCYKKAISCRRPKLAYLSPLPPERSGISDYSAELLPELSRYYDIDVVVDSDSSDHPWVKANCIRRDVEWFRANASDYDRVLYHFGNSHFHQHMFDLLNEVPGVVVLHDFFLSGIVAHLEVTGLKQNFWINELYRSHGYRALQERFYAKDTADVVWKYPCNVGVLKAAQGVIVHSDNSRRLAEDWYPSVASFDWSVIPLLRGSNIDCDKGYSRKALNIDDDVFVVCSFGLLGPSKLNHRLLRSWLDSSLSISDKCILVFVGENNLGSYGQELVSAIKDSGCSHRISITGWADAETFHNYLAAADIGVQLRTLSRGETSAAVLDCMSYGLPTIVNANGSMADLNDDAVWMLDDDFDDSDLVKALENLWLNDSSREKYSKSAREVIINDHAPRLCADQYYVAIEKAFRDSSSGVVSLVDSMSDVVNGSVDEGRLLQFADSIAQSFVPPFSVKQLFVDISELVKVDSKSGIQRVVRSILYELLNNPPAGLRIEPVYATSEQEGYFYARNFTMNFLNCPQRYLLDELIEYYPGDMFIGLDLQPHTIPVQQYFYQKLRRHGVKVQFVVYDLLCILKPQFFVEGAAKGHSRWLEVVAESDGAICISRAVADEVAEWIANATQPKHSVFHISSFHLGANIDNSMPSTGLPNDAKDILKLIYEKCSFLMVGTIEPRKGHLQTLLAFEQLWLNGVDVNLVIVGKQGWMVENLIEQIQNHSELGERLFWLNGISDEYLEKVYAVSTCLVAASEGEGFGLPLIEAAQHKIPIIARDIPVFREVAMDYAYYFQGGADDIAIAVTQWMTLFRENLAPSSESMPWLTWSESTKQLLNEVLDV